MRNHQPAFPVSLADYAVAVEQNVQIERTRAVGEACRAVASELLLDGQQAAQQSLRLKFRLQRNNGIYKSRLIGESDRLGGVER